MQAAEVDMSGEVAVTGLEAKNTFTVVSAIQSTQSTVVKQAPPPPYHQHIVDQQARQKKQEGQNHAGSKNNVNQEDKKKLYRHELFPLLALLFEKCEAATQNGTCPSSASIHSDMTAFKNSKLGVKLDNLDETDQLMIKAIQVLRIHLLELEKVNDLCQDFCTRYITCLKTKLQNEQALRANDEGEDLSSQQQQESPLAGVVAGGGTMFRMIQTPQGLVAQPVQLQPASTPIIVQGSTPLSQIGNNNARPNKVLRVVNADDESKSRRGVLPKQATQIMKSWLFQHIVHPYPSEDEKKTLSTQTGLSILQINNWFINARRRILQPMIDTSPCPPTASPGASIKKQRHQPHTRPHKHWPPHELSQLTDRQQDDSMGELSGDMDVSEHMLQTSDHVSADENMEANERIGADETVIKTDALLADQQIRQTELEVARILGGSDVTAHQVTGVGGSDLSHVSVSHVSNAEISNMISNVQSATHSLQSMTSKSQFDAIPVVQVQNSNITNTPVLDTITPIDTAQTGSIVTSEDKECSDSISRATDNDSPHAVITPKSEVRS